MDKIAKQDLIHAKAKHYVFKSKLRAYLEGSTEVSEAILADHNACVLGKWINEVGKVKYDRYTEIAELDTIHQRIHSTAREIIELKKKGEQKAIEAKMTTVNKIGGEIIEKIDELSDRLSEGTI
ncbi:MAG: CZB domain-containing protein [Cytophagales bacterium]|nr:CZB domain-containing protein [Cytophaga sp.]